MSKCEHCGSDEVTWFTPPRYADRAAVLLCTVCARLTIVPARAVARRARRLAHAA
jgi:hypothetical protein